MAEQIAHDCPLADPPGDETWIAAGQRCACGWLAWDMEALAGVQRAIDGAGPWLPVAEAARAAGAQPASYWNAVHAGRVPSISVGGRRFVREADARARVGIEAGPGWKAGRARGKRHE